MPGFAVIDLETTGLNPHTHDRVVELAIVHVDEFGNTAETWETLINPARDLGPQHVHGIRSADILDAPAFADVVGDVIELLQGRVLVAHNASFDSRFLYSEFERSGVPLWQQPNWLCTMQLARQCIPGSGRSLADCCAAYDIELVGAHRACVDAVATAQLLSAYMGAIEREFWYSHIDAALDFTWPLAPTVGGTRAWKPRPEYSTESTAASFLERITLKLPEHAGPAEHTDYLALLDRALLDRHLSVHETNALVDLAETLGISRTTVVALHAEYFDALTAVAWADGVLTDAELADLAAVADLLDIPTDRIADAMAPRITEAPSTQGIGDFTLSPGDLVVLTGEMRRPREQIEADLAARGFVPWSGVTKKVKLLVAADPDSLSGKAKKARDYGIPVVSEDALGRLLGV
ncbi:DNA polymerase-3 subunit epsilon [Microbacteriaceae bacterium SG_E_30_P1]|uniref:DNA polymerase-3 subunit epsilon n=1 Tax=Antiquaquibacter oligotrophicus TaxID=2880260 RepID=A0ABT6KLV2_9MICO|nr:exonuclease domain-containing protein [Antiquaquibacter oligotrophicus]MDH6180087.1 DNA polymerase-3 subunit epsilon [Antiquaquibacter oligotrophicus]UDF14162.1 DNA polymerase III subunit epsilon [Antiquaquibacter oligotrophicus]